MQLHHTWYVGDGVLHVISPSTHSLAEDQQIEHKTVMDLESNQQGLPYGSAPLREGCIGCMLHKLHFLFVFLCCHRGVGRTAAGSHRLQMSWSCCRLEIGWAVEAAVAPPTLKGLCRVEWVIYARMPKGHTHSVCWWYWRRGIGHK